jgi:putative heme iron utilization protein
MNKKVVERIGAFFLVSVSNFLALDAVGSPRDSVQPLEANVLLAMSANAKRAFIDAVQSRADVSKHVRLTVKISDRQFTFGRILDLVQSVRALLDRDAFPVSQHLRQLSLFVLQDFFEFV